MKLSDLTLEEAEARCAALETLFGDRFAFTVLRFPDNEIDDDRLWRGFIRIMSQFFSAAVGENRSQEGPSMTITAKRLAGLMFGRGTETRD